MTRAEAAIKAGYRVYDTDLPQGWWDTMHAYLKEVGAEVTNPISHFVWVYEDKHGSCGLFGIPGPLTDVGRRALEGLDRRDECEHVVSPSLSGVHE